ncbi:MAG TPA: BlaI/MecI/CopY family transcriptional regulator [Gemmataceae bacterium]|jgi:predicted transcriptional regulator|nr:BlaI/MecI/CopY family transcriptional regulator [Gemmataceae bacterium]
MAGKPEEHLSRRERQIMDIIYARGQAAAAEVFADLPDPPGKTAVRTLLRILEEKGHLKHKQEGLRYIYQPSRARGHAGRSALQRVLRTFFDGSLEKAVAAHLGDSASDLSAEELARLADLINQARKKGR